MDRFIILFVGLLGISCAYGQDILPAVRWQCVSPESGCSECSVNYADTKVEGCMADGSAFQSKEECETHEGCGSMRWHCAGATVEGGECSSCNMSDPSSPCDAVNFHMKSECEVATAKCGPRCDKAGETYQFCGSCELSCTSPSVADHQGCSPFGCSPGCKCAPGTFRNGDNCTTAAECPKVPNRSCYNLVVEAYKNNVQQINATTWPHSQPFYIPQCTHFGGRFKPRQCSYHDGECLCVNPLDGTPVKGTKSKADVHMDCNGPPVVPPGVVDPPAPPTGNNPPESCPDNEVFTECHSSSCLPRCDNPNPALCTADCFRGCICKVGYFRNAQGTCVNGKQCETKGVCHKQVLEILSDGLPPPGRLIPSCTADGQFEDIQCHEAGCWCVEPATGVEVPGTRKTPQPSAGPPKCAGSGGLSPPGTSGPQVGPNGETCGQNEEYQTCFSSSCQKTCDNPAPQVCTADCRQGCACKEGFYKTSDGKCVAGTECVPKGECHSKLLKTPIQPGLVGAFKPRCEDDGSFQKEQCHGSTGHCWCVDPATGQEVDGTRKGPTEPRPSCDSAPVPVPNQCAENEVFKKCQSSTCEPSCANPRPIACTRDCVDKCACVDGFFRDGAGKCVLGNVCEAKGSCHATILNATQPALLGKFIPRCKVDGTFEKKQCHGSIGVCWCVLEESGDEIQGTRMPRGQSPQCDGGVQKQPGAPETCPAHSTFQQCGTACEPSCERPAPTICTLQCVAECQCDPGYLRHNAACVKPSACPATDKPCLQAAFVDIEAGRTTAPDFQLRSCDEDGNFEVLKCGPEFCVCIDKVTGNEKEETRRAGGETPPRCFEENVDERRLPVVVSGQTDVSTCGENAEHNDCGSACPETCETVNATEPRACIASCVSGCQCKPGFVKHMDRCITADKCPNADKSNGVSTCGENAEYSECASACPDTCETVNATEPRVCIASCVNGCQCKPGFVKYLDRCITADKCPTAEKSSGAIYSWQCSGDPAGKRCVSCNLHLDECAADLQKFGSMEKCEAHSECGSSSPQCGSNEHFITCGSACPDTCANKDKAPGPCTKQCVKGCFCLKGYRRSQKGKCVLEAECPAEDDDGIQWQCFKSESGCKSCKFADCDTAKRSYGSYEQCAAAGQCGNGGSQCGPKETFNVCGGACAPTCEQPGPRACTRDCVPGCFCQDGLFRNSKGDCVNSDACQKHTKCLETFLSTYKDNGPPPGAFLPVCRANGHFKALQCHGSTGQCWCVNPKTGEELPKTRSNPGEAPPKCGGKGL